MKIADFIEVAAPEVRVILWDACELVGTYSDARDIPADYQGAELFRIDIIDGAFELTIYSGF